MGQVSRAFFTVGFGALVPVVILTIISLIFPTFIAETSWFNNVVTAFIVGLLFGVALSFIVFGAIIVKRDSE